MRRCLFSILLLLTFCLHSLAQNTNVEQALRQLDDAVKLDSVYTSREVSKINGIKNSLKLAVTPVDKYFFMKQLGNEYSHLCSDSAIVYYQSCYKLGQDNFNTAWIQDAVIHQALVLSDRGDDHIAYNILLKIGDIDAINDNLKSLYAEAKLMCTVRLTSNTSRLLNNTDIKAMWTKYSRYMSADGPFYYRFYKVAYPDYDVRKMKSALLTLLKRLKPFTTQDARARKLLAECYLKEKNSDKAIEQLALSATGDIRCVNKNSSSITMLITELLKKDVSDKMLMRLFKYSTVNANNISTFNDMGRSIHLIKVQEQILSGYQKQINQRQKRQVLMTSVAVLLLLVSLILLWRLWKFNGIIHRQKKELQKNLQQLESEVDVKSKNLDSKNEIINELSTERHKADKILAQQFALLSKILADVKAYKKAVANSISMGVTAAAKKLVKESFTRDQTTAEFYKVFDSNFLFVHPDFPKRLDGLLKPECRIGNAKEGELSPEQRIYALISLGISDSKSLAEILHYSIQTIYNYRQKMRNGSLDPDKKIDQQVTQLYVERHNG